MILSVIFHFFKTVIGYAIKIIAWLLVALSLWVPLLYSLIFIIVCGLTEVSITSVQSWFWAGLALSFVGSFFVSTLIYERRLAKKKRAKTESAPAAGIEKVKEKQDETLIKKRDANSAVAAAEEEPAQSSLPETAAENPAKEGPSLMERLKQGSPELKPNDTAGKYNFISYNPVGNQGGGQQADNNQNNLQNNLYNQSGFAGNQDNNAGYSGYNSGDMQSAGEKYQSNFNPSGINNFQNNSRTNEFRGGYEDFSSGFNRSADSGEYGRPASETLSRSGYGLDYNDNFGNNFAAGGGNAATGSEQPKIFVTRSDPTILIYEYSDKLEYYKRTRAGLLLFKTRIKESSSN